MKCNIFPTIISVVLASLLAYLTYTIAEGKQNDILCGIISFVCYVSTLLSVLALRSNSTRLNVNIRITSVAFFLTFLISNNAFAATTLAMPYYIIIHGLLLTIFTTVMYKFFNNKDI